MPDGDNFTPSREDLFVLIESKVYVWGRVVGVINCANFLKNGLRVSEVQAVADHDLSGP